MTDYIPTCELKLEPHAANLLVEILGTLPTHAVVKLYERVQHVVGEYGSHHGPYEFTFTSDEAHQIKSFLGNIPAWHGADLYRIFDEAIKVMGRKRNEAWEQKQQAWRKAGAEAMAKVDAKIDALDAVDYRREMGLD